MFERWYFTWFNLKSDKFVGSKKELEKGNLQIGMELEIPKE